MVAQWFTYYALGHLWDMRWWSLVGTVKHKRLEVKCLGNAWRQYPGCQAWGGTGRQMGVESRQSETWSDALARYLLRWLLWEDKSLGYANGAEGRSQSPTQARRDEVETIT